ncbi:transporter substrate-binding domain-containing protein [Agrococcus sp. HG114]|uniref:transporter substrate-binding domain-containing protein n=1 Tax=Agrococcus sp. HG114 TaxID=2969757 RepID=UPI00215AC35C|nr:transporter substrate-binding domain-containing protein [Agrococcus sp. HG114]MCR8669601.1 transporter substrate-binding domain-containing protein [Agrococcus sp. HG114]
MKKSLLVIGAAAATITLLAGCSAGSAAPEASGSAGGDASSNAPEGLVNPGQLSACIDPEYAPLEYYANGSDGEIIGFDADGIRALADHWGVETNMVVTSFDGLMPGLQSGTCDMIFGGLYITEERLAVADASPVMNAGSAILAKPELAPELTEPADLCGLTVAVQAASSNELELQSINETECGDDPMTIQSYPKTAETVLAVVNGLADALTETNVAAAYMETQNEGRLAVADVFPTDTVFGVFTQKGSPVSAAVAEGLRALHDDGTLASIAEEYNLDADIVDVY